MRGASDLVDTRLAELETLSNLLGKTQTVEASLAAALRYILQITGRTSGLIYLSPAPGGTAQHNPAPVWLAQIADPASPLRQLIDKLLAGHPPVPNDLPADLALAAMVPIATANTRAGALLVSGPPCAPEELNWLGYLGRFLGRAIEQHPLFAATRDRSQELTASVANAIDNARLFHQLTVANADLAASRGEVIRSRSTLQALLDGIPHPIYIVDRDYRLVAVNLASAAPRLTARENERRAWLGRLCYQTLFGQAQPCTGCRMAETLAAGQSTQRAERRWDADGQPTEWDISTHPIFDENDQTLQVIIINQDVTEKHRLETSLAQSEKMAAVGQLAAGVAHEINNPLAAIIANTQLLQRDLPADDERQESLELIGKAGDRALRVVRNLLDFARQDRYEFTATDVNDTLQSALDLIEHQLRTHSINLECNLAPNLPLIQASHDHLQGVWLNLLLNARDAFAGQSGQIQITTARQGEEIRITVADTGMGIPPERLSKIFEPFYTTKQAGQGTGLGLSLCQRIVKQHGGRILVDSQIRQGTVFTVILPIAPLSSI